MKFSLSLFFLVFFLLTFSQEQVNLERTRKIDSLTRLQQNEINKQLAERQKQCDAETEEAEKVALTKNQYFLFVPSPSFLDFFQKEEFKQILAQHNIEFGGVEGGSCLPGYYSFGDCYKLKITELSEKKFGLEFFEEKKREALELYVKNNPDRIFNSKEYDYPWSNKNYRKDFLDSFAGNYWIKFPNLPSTYQTKNENENSSFISVSFNLDEKGKIISPLDFEFDFQNKKNEKLKNIFKNNIEKYVRSISWMPSTLEGIPVKSNMDMTIYLP